MSKLSESLLTLAKLDSGETKGTVMEVKLDEVVSEAVEMLRPLAAENKVEIQRDLSPIRCHGNAGQLNQVLVNLVSNAIHYNREGGKVMVSLYNENNKSILNVQDTGIGIDDESRQQLFERFFRVDKARSTKAGGAGLGLAIVDAIIRAHGGTINVESELGVGTTFIVTLPALMSGSG